MQHQAGANYTDAKLRLQEAQTAFANGETNVNSAGSLNFNTSASLKNPHF